MPILFESVSKESEQFEYNGETIINFGTVVIADTLDEIVNYEASTL
jgi:hypothetical protein